MDAASGFDEDHDTEAGRAPPVALPAPMKNNLADICWVAPLGTTEEPGVTETCKGPCWAETVVDRDKISNRTAEKSRP
jgi:hypothetical protein